MNDLFSVISNASHLTVIVRQASMLMESQLGHTFTQKRNVCLLLWIP